MGHVKLANYALAYKKIKNAAFDGPGSQSTVLFFVAADVDAICAFRILTVTFHSQETPKGFDCSWMLVVHTHLFTWPSCRIDPVQVRLHQLCGCASGRDGRYPEGGQAT